MNILSFFKHLLHVSALALLGCSLQAGAAVVYSNDFESSTTGFNNPTTTALPTTAAGFGSAPQSTFLGPFSNNTVTLTLTGLVPATVYNVTFDLFIGASWDGNSTSGAGPDVWRLTTNATPATLVNTTFLNLLPNDGILNNFTQNYSDATPTGSGAFPALTGADIAQSSGSIFDRYGIYYFSHGSGNPQLSFLSASATQTLTFQGIGLQATNDEFWALDNVVVSTLDAAVPEPATALFGFGTLLTILGARRRKA